MQIFRFLGLNSVGSSVCLRIMTAPYSNDSVVHSVKGGPAAGLSLDANPSNSAAVLVDAVKAIPADHDNRIASLGLCEHGT